MAQPTVQIGSDPTSAAQTAAAGAAAHPGRSSVEVSGLTGALSYFNTVYAAATEPGAGQPIYSTPVGADGAADEDLHLFYADGAWMLNDAGGSWEDGEETQCKAFVEADGRLPEGRVEWLVWDVDAEVWEPCPITLVVRAALAAAPGTDRAGTGGSTAAGAAATVGVPDTVPAAEKARASPSSARGSADVAAHPSKLKAKGWRGCCGSRVRAVCARSFHSCCLPTASRGASARTRTDVMVVWQPAHDSEDAAAHGSTAAPAVVPAAVQPEPGPEPELQTEPEPAAPPPLQLQPVPQLHPELETLEQPRAVQIGSDPTSAAQTAAAGAAAHPGRSSVEVSGLTGALSYFNTVYAAATEPGAGQPIYSTPVGADGAADEDLHLFYADGAWMLNDAGGSWEDGEETQCKAFVEADGRLPEGRVEWLVWDVDAEVWEPCPITLVVRAALAAAPGTDRAGTGGAGGGQVSSLHVAESGQQQGAQEEVARGSLGLAEHASVMAADLPDLPALPDSDALWQLFRRHASGSGDEPMLSIAAVHDAVAELFGVAADDYPAALESIATIAHSVACEHDDLISHEEFTSLLQYLQYFHSRWPAFRELGAELGEEFWFRDVDFQEFVRCVGLVNVAVAESDLKVDFEQICHDGTTTLGMFCCWCAYHESPSKHEVSGDHSYLAAPLHGKHRDKLGELDGAVPAHASTEPPADRSGQPSEPLQDGPSAQPLPEDWYAAQSVNRNVARLKRKGSDSGASDCATSASPCAVHESLPGGQSLLNLWLGWPRARWLDFAGPAAATLDLHGASASTSAVGRNASATAVDAEADVPVPPSSPIVVASGQPSAAAAGAAALKKLHVAAQRGCVTAVTNALVAAEAAGGHVDDSDPGTGNTALHWAAVWDRAAVVRCVVQQSNPGRQ